MKKNDYNMEIPTEAPIRGKQILTQYFCQNQKAQHKGFFSKPSTDERRQVTSWVMAKLRGARPRDRLRLGWHGDERRIDFRQEKWSIRENDCGFGSETRGEWRNKEAGLIEEAVKLHGGLTGTASGGSMRRLGEGYERSGGEKHRGHGFSLVEFGDGWTDLGKNGLIWDFGCSVERN